jgi:hypothetical protein
MVASAKDEADGASRSVMEESLEDDDDERSKEARRAVLLLVGICC